MLQLASRRTSRRVGNTDVCPTDPPCSRGRGSGDELGEAGHYPNVGVIGSIRGKSRVNVSSLWRGAWT